MSVKLKTKITIIALQVMSCCYSATTWAEDSVEFNTDVLDAADRTRIDLTRFATDNYITPGDYLLDIRINGQPVGQRKFVTSTPLKASARCRASTAICWTSWR